MYHEASDKLEEKEEEISSYKRELSQYRQIAQRLEETEKYLDNFNREKEAREEELINKLGVLAEHYHKEKDKNSKLIGEIHRQSESLERFDLILAANNNERDQLTLENDSLKEELTRMKV